MYLYENKYLIFDRPKSRVKFFIKRIINFFQRFFYAFVYFLFRPKQRNANAKHKVSICAIFKDEADYLKEWIEFHKIVGVEHFYLYNNLSTDGYKKVIDPYIKKNEVTLIDWIIPHGQMSAYADFFSRFSKETKWVGFIDIDEFVVPNTSDNLYSFLKNFNNRSSVVINWKMFGSSGIIDRNIKGLVIEDFVSSWSKYSDIGKFFFNTNYDYFPKHKRDGYMHHCWAKCRGISVPPVNIFGKVFTYEIMIMKNKEIPVQINHYVTKSFNEYMTRKTKRGGGVHPLMHDEEFFREHDSKCTSTDYHILRFLDKLKKNLYK